MRKQPSMRATFSVSVEPGKDARLTWREIAEAVEAEIERLEDGGWTVDPQTFQMQGPTGEFQWHYSVEFKATRE